MLASLSMERWTCVSIPILVPSDCDGAGAFVSSSRVVLRRVVHPRVPCDDAHVAHDADAPHVICDGLPTTSSPSSLVLGAAPKSDQGQQSGVSTVMEFGQLGGDYEHSPDTSGASQTIVAEKCCNLHHQHGCARTSTSPCSCSTHAQEEQQKHKKRKVRYFCLASFA